MANYIRNFRWEVADGKTYLYMHNRPQYALDMNNNWVDLEELYKDVIPYVETPGQDIPEELLVLHNEYMDVYNNFYLSGELPDVIVDTTDPTILDAWTRTDSIKEIEMANGILYPREMVWVDGAPDITGIIILPHDDYSSVYTINEDGTLEYLNEYTEGMQRPYYIKENGKTYMYVNHFSGGAGTQEDPYLISTPEELDAIRNNLSAYYKLTNHIDMRGWGNFFPIGAVNGKSTTIRFTGTFDGNGYIINNLTISRTDYHYNALFVVLGTNGTVKNLGITNCNITSTGTYLGASAIVSHMYTNSLIENCFSTGIIGNGKRQASGICGLIVESPCIIRNCWSTATINGEPDVGGIVAQDNSGGTIDKCYYAGSITGISRTGTIIGSIYSDYNTIITDCHWDTEVTGLSNGWGVNTPSNSTGSSGLTTAQMQTQSSYTNWDFDTIWYMNEYPKLRAIPYAVSSSVLSVINENILGFNTFVNYNIDTDFNKGIYTNTKVVDGKLTLNREGE